MKFLSSFFLSLIVFSINSQSVVGLWSVTEVTVGEERMTPVAKWIDIEEDLSYESGNGWTKNDEGRIDLDLKKNTFIPRSNNGIEDLFEAFDLKLDSSEMFWSRMEDGMMVYVSLAKIKNRPAGPADQILGAWTSISDPSEQLLTALHMRPDRLYTQYFASGEQVRGYWHMHGHRPELTLIPFNKDLPNQTYATKFESPFVVFMDGEKSMRFKRSKSLPD